MCRIERIGDLDRNSKCIPEIKRPSRDAFAQCFPIQQFHRNEMLAAGLTGIKNRADIGMIQCGGRTSFTVKALDGSHVVRDLMGQELERYLASETSVLGAIDNAHAAASNLFNNPVVRNSGSEH